MEELRDQSVEELVSYDLKRDWRPQAEGECEAFFQNVSERILARSQRIIMAVKEKLAAYAQDGCSLEDLSNQMLGEEAQ